MMSDESLRESLTGLSPSERTEFLASLSNGEHDWLNARFGVFAHKHQRPPKDIDWTTWLILGGRGAGKTRAGAEWVRAQAQNPAARIALIGETARDVREVMIEGVSGLLAVHEHGARPTWEPSRALVTFESGAIAQAFSAEDPDSLRGPQ